MEKLVDTERDESYSCMSRIEGASLASRFVPVAYCGSVLSLMCFRPQSYQTVVVVMETAVATGDSLLFHATEVSYLVVVADAAAAVVAVVPVRTAVY
jgi:hypothetical protein